MFFELCSDDAAKGEQREHKLRKMAAEHERLLQAIEEQLAAAGLDLPALRAFCDDSANFSDDEWQTIVAERALAQRAFDKLQNDMVDRRTVDHDRRTLAALPLHNLFLRH